MSRRVYLLGVGLALVALALAFTDWALTPPSGVTAANARRIHKGMDRAAVEAILGRPSIGLAYDHSSNLLDCWETNQLGIYVAFDNFDRVTTVTWRRLGTGSSPSCFARLRAWLGW